MTRKEVMLKVSEAFQQDVGYGRARIDHQTRIELDLSIGDIIEMVGTKSTSSVVWRAHPTDEGKQIIRIDNLTRKNVGTGLGDTITIRKATVSPAHSVVLAPLISKGQQIQFGSGIEILIKKGLLKRPLTKGDNIIVPNIALFGSALPFVILNTSPNGIVSINEDTVIQVKEEAAQQLEPEGPHVSYEDIGGLKDELEKVKEMIQLPIKHPKIFNRLGIDPPKGVLLHGPPGTGKTLIAKAVANESGASFYTINGPEIMSKFYGQSEENLRKIFDEAEKNAPSIIFIDEIDAIAGKRSETHGEVEKRVVSQLLTLMDGLKGRGNLIVIGATNIPDSLDPALRRPGRFDREIRIDAPDRDGRKEILQIHTRGMPKAENVDLEKLSDKTYGYVGADLAALARESAMNALRRYLPEIDLEKPIPVELLEKMEVTMDDFKNAQRGIEPSAMREFFVEIPRVGWADVGGMESVKQQLRESVEWPLSQPEVFKRLGITPPRGILLYGPPGTGKTLLAKAVAFESDANFISIKGPEVMSKWVGESEKAVRELFKKAKQVAPAIVFLDELDAIAPRRGTYSGSHVTESVVNQLLTSIDGLESMEGVVVIGATNRPDIIDQGLLRPGRFDRLILTPSPNAEARLDILKIHTKSMPLSSDVLLESLAKKTDGFSGADIEALCREAAMIALRENIKIKKVEAKHFEDALKNARPSLTEEVLKYYQTVAKDLGSSLAKKDKRDKDIQYL
ncbi:MAG: CDC48 family AAA ATPase [Thermoplasmatota archaeon]